MTMQFILEICDPKTECIIENVSFQTVEIGELSTLLDMADFDADCVYELDENDVRRIKEHFFLKFEESAALVKLRSRCELDDLPYKIHTNCELVLMLAGTKPLASFCGEYPPCSDIEEIPERLFDPYVVENRFVKREYVVPQAHGRAFGTRRVLYSLPSEVWRIDAYILLQQTASKSGWNEGFERMEGSLLGYEEWQNDAYIDTIYKDRKARQ